jgi:hypothetical protein
MTFLGTVTYKPRTKFRLPPVTDEESKVCPIMVSLWCQNADAPGWIKISQTFTVTEQFWNMVKGSPTALQRMVRAWLLELEFHEANEHLRFSGVKVFDPHKE